MRTARRSLIQEVMDSLESGESPPLDRYFSYRHLVTDECHIFHGKYNPTEKKCSIDKDRTSICQKMTIKTAKEQEAEEVFECFNEQEAREKCARLGREVCGICVSNLYSNVEMLIDPYD